MLVEKIVFLIIVITSGVIVTTVIYHILCDCGDLLARTATIQPVVSQQRRNQKIREIVLHTSEWYKQVIALNEQTSWNENILDNGHSECYMFTDSKAKFDRANPWERLVDFLEAHRERIISDRELVRENWDINEWYMEQFNALSSKITHEKCNLLGVEYEEYIKIEKSLIEQIRLPIITSYVVTCKVVYTTPRGRKRYEREISYNDFDIDDAFLRIDRKKREELTENDRRQSERSKVTPSLRYDVMKRDSFRCCLCGRSSQNGVELEVDHIIPISKGGTSDIHNLQTLCRDCNRGKGAKY